MAATRPDGVPVSPGAQDRQLDTARGRKEVLSLANVRVRFAPSPTGYLHIGGARTALFNYLFARHNGGTFILRIEDTDTERTIKDSAEKLMEAFRFLGLNWDEGPIVGGPKGPYYQSQRQELYQKYAEELLQKGKAYKCYCTPEELAAERAQAQAEHRAPRYSGRCRSLTPEQVKAFEAEGRKPVIRLKTKDTGTTTVHDLIHGDVTFKNEEIADFVILKSDGFPTYNYACVIDDWQMGLTHVLRADEHLSNTPKQIWIYEALGIPMPQFGHFPMILAPDRSKLSKRHGAQTVEEFQQKGYLPDAIRNYLVLLGWTPADATKEIMSLEEMVKEFSLDRVSSTPAVYDVKKMTWMNGQYMRKLTPDELVEWYLKFAVPAGIGTEEELRAKGDWLKKALVSLQERSQTLEELVESSRFYFGLATDGSAYDEAAVRKLFTKPGIADLLRKGAAALGALTEWNLETEEKAYRDLIEREGIKGGDLIHPTRLALTGKTVGPGLFEIVDILGKDESVARLNAAAAYIEEKGLESAKANQ
jgi:glutamyl-tRNA synthetase